MYNREYKGDVCSHSHAFFLDNVFRRLVQSPQKIVGPYIAPGDTVIDLGCGPGYFTLDMAEMTGEKGRVIAVDLQKEMLEKVAQKAQKKGLADRILLHNCPQETIGLEPDVQAQFILAFYMVHETPDPKAFLREVKTHLKPGGRFLLVEPLFHVSGKDFKAIQENASDIGFKILKIEAGLGGRSLLMGV